MQIVTINDATAKWLSDDFSPWQIAWFRFLFQGLFMVPFVVFSGRSINTVKTEFFSFPTFIRGLFWMVSATSFFLAIANHPIPSVLGVSFIAPLVVVVLANFLLKERFEISGIVAVFFGLVGVLIVLRPFGDAFQPTLLLALLSGITYGGYIMATRYLSKRQTPATSVFMSALWATLLGLPMALIFWTQIDALVPLMLLASVGLVTAVGHYFIAQATRLAEASVVAPFNYTEIVGATLISALVFQDLPSLWDFLGIGVVLASGAYILVKSTNKPLA